MAKKAKAVNASVLAAAGLKTLAPVQPRSPKRPKAKRKAAKR